MSGVWPNLLRRSCAHCWMHCSLGSAAGMQQQVRCSRLHCQDQHRSTEHPSPVRRHQPCPAEANCSPALSLLC